MHVAQRCTCSTSSSSHLNPLAGTIITTPSHTVAESSDPFKIEPEMSSERRPEAPLHARGNEREHACNMHNAT